MSPSGGERRRGAAPPHLADRRRRRKRRDLLVWVGASIVVVLAAAAVGFWASGHGRAFDGAAADAGAATTIALTSATTIVPSTTTTAAPTTTTAAPTTSTTLPEPGDVRVPGTHYGPINTAFAGVTMFRGNGSRTYYGEGPVPRAPEVLWRFGPMEGLSTHNHQPKVWTGTGWTGQPAVFERDGRTWVAFGAYDKQIHFLDADTGERLYPDFPGGDIYKGSVTVDPDGFPLVYMGCRDNDWKVIAIDGPEPKLLWKMNAYDTEMVWNDDWDGNVVVRDDYAFVPGENSHFFIVKLNRSYGDDRRVRVEPEVVLDFPGYTQQLFRDIGDREVSIENSPALVGDRVYFSNSGGLVHGLDVSATLTVGSASGDVSAAAGEPARGLEAYPEVFQYWMGDDTDASIVIDDQGFLYVAAELQRFLPRATEVGQIVKLDPRKGGAGEDPLVWSVPVTKRADEGLSGVWATPALYREMLYVPTHEGSLLGIDRETGETVWRRPFTTHTWGSAVVVDGTLLVGDTAGTLHAYDVRDTRVEPSQLWTVQLPSHGALESTPVVWRGRIFVGSRDGYFYCLGDR